MKIANLLGIKDKEVRDKYINTVADIDILRAAVIDLCDSIVTKKQNHVEYTRRSQARSQSRTDTESESSERVAPMKRPRKDERCLTFTLRVTKDIGTLLVTPTN